MPKDSKKEDKITLFSSLDLKDDMPSGLSAEEKEKLNTPFMDKSSFIESMKNIEIAAGSSKEKAEAAAKEIANDLQHNSAYPPKYKSAVNSSELTDTIKNLQNTILTSCDVTKKLDKEELNLSVEDILDEDIDC